MAIQIAFSCKVCDAKFYRQAGQLRSYRKKYGKDPLYCSTACGGKGRMLSDDKWQVHCVQCGELMPVQRRPGGTINRLKRLCSTACRSKFRQERAGDRFRNGQIFTHRKRGGYIWMSIPAHASRTGKKMEMLEHRYVMEQSIGRHLRPDETVHHINGVRDENRIENLELFSSRHGPGQRVVDKVAFAIQILTDYPEFTSDAGYELVRKAIAHDAA